MCVEVKIGRNSIIIYLVDAPELNTGRDEAFRKHISCIEQILNNNTIEAIVIGDFNIRGVRWQPAVDGNYFIPNNIPINEKSGFREFLSSMQYISILQIANIPNDAGNCLDLVFTRNESLLTIHHAPTTLINIKQTDSAHPPIEIALNLPSDTYTTENFSEVFAYSRGNYQRMVNELNAINYAAVFHRMSIEGAVDYFYDVLNSVIRNNIPKIKIKCNNNKPMWWNADLQKLKNKRNKEWKKGGSQNEQYLIALENINELNELTHNNYEEDIQIQFKYNPSLFWKYARVFRID